MWSTGETTQTIEVDTTSIVSLTITDDNGCSGSDTIEVILAGPCAGIADRFRGASVSYFPNPTDGMTILLLEGFKSGSFQLRITDVNGQVVREEQHSNVGSTFQHRMDLGNFAQGVYFIELISEGESRTNRISVF